MDRAAHRAAIAQFFYASPQLALNLVDGAGNPLFEPIELALADRTEVLGESLDIADVLPAARHYYSAGGGLVTHDSYHRPPTATASRWPSGAAAANRPQRRSGCAGRRA